MEVRAASHASQNGPFWLTRCRRCSLVYLNPRPAEHISHRFYEDAYLPFVSSREDERVSLLERLYAAARRWNLRWKRRQIESLHPQKGRLLDVGCGTGEFLREMVQHGWQGKGVERDRQAVQFAIHRYRLKVYAGLVEDLPDVNEAFDVITLWHVLEHLYAPHKALQKIRDLLRPQGTLVIAVPNVESMDARFYGERWVALDVPRHLQHFSLKTLRHLCEMHGLQLVRWQNLPLDSLFNALMSEAQAMSGVRARWLAPLKLARAGVVAGAALTAGLFKTSATRFRGSTLLTFWKKSVAHHE
ncbi:MAG: class I SAM-dependent methyltransferase [candidate division KSB1 bacterium]|nr:class I SAM-dependent methyltransferase [candidate division KSB1 bacterium]